MLTHLTTAACLLSIVYAQLPPSYAPAKTNTTLGVRYGSINVKPGQTLAYNVPTTPPTLSLPSSTNTTSNTTYIALLIDPTHNLSAPNPASLLWFQQALSPSISIPNTTLLTTSTTPQVPYLAPSTPNHAYLFLLYASPADFSIPPDFPYKDSFRTGFNVSRVEVDFKTPLVAGNWFVLGGNCTTGAAPSRTGGGFASATATGGFGHAMKGPVARNGGLRLRV